MIPEPTPLHRPLPTGESFRGVGPTRPQQALEALPVVAIFLAVALSSARATAESWTPIGPEGGDITALAVAPSRPAVVYAAGFDGRIFRSEDEARTWSMAGRLPDGSSGEAISLAVDPTDPRTLWAGGVEKGSIARSRDGGATWEVLAIPGAGSDSTVRVVGGRRVRPGRTPTLYALAFPGVFHSRDGGETWEEIAASLPFATSLAVHPEDTDVLYLATVDGVYFSTDRGSSWADASGGLPPEGVGLLSIAPGAPETLYARLDGDEGQRIFRTDDGGEHWRPTADLPFRRINQALLGLHVDAGDPRRVLVIDWEQEERVPVEPSELQRLLNAKRRIAISDDAGETWEILETSQLPARAALTLLADPVRPGVFYAGAVALGVVVSVDGGVTWERRVGGLNGAAVRSLATVVGDPRDPARRDLLATFGQALAVRPLDDPEAGWSPVLGEAIPPIEQVFPAPSNPAILYAVGQGRVYRSDDAGAHWHDLPDPPSPLWVEVLAVAPSDPSVVYVSGVFSFPFCGHPSLFCCPIFRSTDRGETWTCSAEAFASGEGDFPATDLAVDPNNPAVVYAALGGIPIVFGVPSAVLRTDNGGRDWEPVGDGIDAERVALDPLRPATVYVASRTTGMSKSTDRGATWTTVGAGLPEDVRVEDLIIDPVNTSTLHAVLGTDGAFVSTDGGANWAPEGEDLPPGVALTSLTNDPGDASTLFAGSSGQGVFRLQTADTGPCRKDGHTLCLNRGRFEVDVAWRDFADHVGPGQAERVTDDTGSFWFFSPDNTELVVKVLDARSLGGFFWVFYGSLSNVEYKMVVRDTFTGETRSYFNPRREFASVGDTRAFPLSDRADPSPADDAAAGVASAAGSLQRAAAAESSPCVVDETTHCLNQGRFRVRVEWEDFQGGSGQGRAIPWRDDSGIFWFFHPDNVELIVKVIDARVLNRHFWVFYGALSNVGYTLTVTDTETGMEKTYINPPRRFASAGDTEAFPDGSLCGGFAGLPCEAGEVCDLPAGTCNSADLFGTCRSVPEVCPAVEAPVCGCDGVTYDNDCERLRVGVSKDHDAACG